MKKYILTIVLISILVSKINAQSDDGSDAHIQPYTLQVFGSFDTRYPAIMLKPEIDLKLLNGKLQIGGFGAFQLTKVETWDKEIENPNKSIVGTNYNRNYSGYEIQAGFNFYDYYNANATVASSRTLGDWRIITIEPGSRAIQVGGHVGHGAFVSKTGIYDHPFDLKDANGNVYTSDNSATNSVYSHETYANIIQEYLFAGLHINHAKKPDSKSDHARGGTYQSAYIDVVFPTKVWIGKMYSAVNEEYTAVPKTGEKWTKAGIKAGYIQRGSGLLSMAVKVETGIMPGFSTYGTGASSLFFHLNVGMAIAPIIHLISFDNY